MVPGIFGVSSPGLRESVLVLLPGASCFAGQKQFFTRVNRVNARFFSPLPLTEAPREVTLAADESHHLANVLRGQPGDPILLLDGLGWEATAEISSIRKGLVSVRIVEAWAVSREPERQLTLAVSLPKGDRQKLLVEKLTELGVRRLIPLRCQRSVAQPVDAALNRLEQQVIAACKQSGRTLTMEIAEPHDLGQLGLLQSTGPRVVAHPGGETSIRIDQLPGGDLLAAIGPEGGFTTEEVSQLLAAGWACLDLGPRLLRIETAAIGLAAKWLL